MLDLRARRTPILVRRTNRKLSGDARRVASTTGGSAARNAMVAAHWKGKVEEAIAERRAGGVTRTLKAKESKKQRRSERNPSQRLSCANRMIVSSWLSSRAAVTWSRIVSITIAGARLTGKWNSWSPR